MVKLRNTALAVPARIIHAGDDGRLGLKLDQPEYGIASGQAGVLYDAGQPELVLGSHNEARIIRNTGFTPRPAQPISDSQAVPETAPVPAASRPSLINRISNLWTGSPETSSGETSSQPDEAASREEPVLKQSDAVLPHVEKPPIMDLPKVDMVQTSLPVEQAKPDTHSDDDDDMDIPAFLRRQAN